MFRKTIQNIETVRTTPNQPVYHQQELPPGYNTERYERYMGPQQEQKPSQRKNISSGQFSQLKKMQAIKTPELVIRQCDPTQLSHYKKPTRLMEENIYPYQGANSSNKKQRLAINPRQKPFDTNFKQPLQEVHFSDRQNRPDRYSQDISHMFQMQQQLQNLKQYMLQFQSEHTVEIKKVRTSLNQMQVECMGELQNVANQVSQQLNKHREDMLNMNKREIDARRDLRYLRDQFNAFVKDNQEKMESLVLEMNNANVKKSKNAQQFGVDLKSSSSHGISGGVGTSMSVNFQNENINLKLYNETSAQLQMLKNQLQQCKQKIQLLEKDTKILQLQKKNSKQQVKQSVKQKIDLKQVQKMIIEKFSEERKKNAFSEKIQDLSMKTKDLYKVYQDMDGNIKGMNDEFARVLNGTIIKKEKMLQAKLVTVEQKLVTTQQKINELTQKLSPQSLLQSLKPQLYIQLTSILQQKSSHTKIIKIREPTSHQKSKLQCLKNTDFTYLVDQQGHLLDCSGNYIVENRDDGSKQRLKIQKDLVYLLEAQGVDVRTL